MTKPSKIYCAAAASLVVSIFLPWAHLGMGGPLFAFARGSLDYWSAEQPLGGVLLGLAAVGACCAWAGEKAWHGRLSLLCAAVANGIVGYSLLRLMSRMIAIPGGREARAFFPADLQLGWGCPLLVASSVVMTAAAVAGLRHDGVAILDRAFFRARAKWFQGALAVLLSALLLLAYVRSQRPKHYYHSVSPEQASAANFALIREGMTFAEVNACLGLATHFPPRPKDLKPGKECWGHWANEFPGIPSVGLSITVRFVGGRVVEKSEQHHAISDD